MKTIIKNIPDTKQNDTLFLNFYYLIDTNAMNLSGYTSALFQMRKSASSLPVLSVTHEDGIDLTNLAIGNILMQADTTGVPVGKYFFDFQLSNNLITTTIRSGEINIVEDYAKV